MLDNHVLRALEFVLALQLYKQTYTLDFVQELERQQDTYIILSQGHHAFEPQPPKIKTTGEATAAIASVEWRHRRRIVRAYAAAGSIICFSLYTYKLI